MILNSRGGIYVIGSMTKTTVGSRIDGSKKAKLIEKADKDGKNVSHILEELIDDYLGRDTSLKESSEKGSTKIKNPVSGKEIAEIKDEKGLLELVRDEIDKKFDKVDGKESKEKSEDKKEGSLENESFINEDTVKEGVEEVIEESEKDKVMDFVDDTKEVEEEEKETETYECWNCGYEKESKFEYCPDCGKKNEWENEEENEEVEENNEESGSGTGAKAVAGVGVSALLLWAISDMLNKRSRRA